MEYTRGRNPGTISGYGGANSGVEVVERNTYTVTNPGSTGWQTASIPLGTAVDADTHSVSVLLPSPPLNGASAIICRGIKYKLSADGSQIDLSIHVDQTSGDIPITYEVFKVNGLSAAISRQQITLSIGTSNGNNDLTISDPGGNYVKSRTLLTHITADELRADDGTSNYYYTDYTSGPTFARTSAINIRTYGRSYSATKNYTFWVEIWPFG